MTSPGRGGLLARLGRLVPGQSALEALQSAEADPRLRAFLEKESLRLARMSRHEAFGEPREVLVAGADEVGRGPMAGPLVAAAVAFRSVPWIPGLRDSKKLQPEEREALVPWIQAQAVSWAVTVVSVEELNEPRGTLHSHSLAAMRACVERLSPRPDRLLVDGRFPVDALDLPQKAVVKGDDACVTVAAASVLAKVHRDGLMTELDRVWPGYGFARHKGYCTPDHLEALQRLGPCPVHRARFARVRERLAPAIQGTLGFED